MVIFIQLKEIISFSGTLTYDVTLGDVIQFHQQQLNFVIRALYTVHVNLHVL